ncbi:MAG: hypothetical protein CMP22_07105 [Rickettsiales bacterium]|nr:hypothetical protein [Rickettsiales bacterium]|tara:strand:+ start:30 stop:1244 length:1215 start_codon:yes stop_codon:yes gene_type:complete
MEYINREASDKTKGFRLQRIRAVDLIFDKLSIKDEHCFYTGVEMFEDTFQQDNLTSEKCNHYEENKNYNDRVNFSLFSRQVKNTLVAFFDIYLGQCQQDYNATNFCFYTTAGVAKENKRTEYPDLPDEPILEILTRDKKVNDEILIIIKKCLIDEYKKQYKSKKTTGFLSDLEEMSLESFQNFLSCISWKFGEQNEENLKERVLEKIRNSKFFTCNHHNKEELIFSQIMENLEQKQNKEGFVNKLLHSSEIKSIFIRVESESPSQKNDPTWQELESIEINDKRNVEEKIYSVKPDFSTKRLGYFARKVVTSRAEQKENDKSMLSLKYRTYESCLDFLSQQKIDFTQDENINNALKEMEQLSCANIQKLKQDYNYSSSNSITVEGLILDLFDGCFLSFDEDQNDI